MRKIALVSLVIMTVLAAAPAAAQGTKGMDSMKGMDRGAADPAQAMHTTRGVVKKLDSTASKATLAHEPGESLDWPAMTMAFIVQDKALLDGLAEGFRVAVDFIREGKDYVITSVK